MLVGFRRSEIDERVWFHLPRGSPYGIPAGLDEGVHKLLHKELLDTVWKHLAFVILGVVDVSHPAFHLGRGPGEGGRNGVIPESMGNMVSKTGSGMTWMLTNPVTGFSSRRASNGQPRA